MSDYFSAVELAAMGFARIGGNVQVHRSVYVVGASKLSLGSDIRIDAFTIITCGSEESSIGDHVHISTHVFIAGRSGFDLGAYSGISSGSKLFTTSDDFSGEFLTGPTFPDTVTNASARRIRIGEHAVTGANSVVIPGGELGEGAILGTLSLAKTVLAPWHIHAGVPARSVKARSRALLGLLPVA